MTNDNEPKFFNTLGEVLARPVREHLFYTAWCAALVVVIPIVSPVIQHLILWVSLAVLAVVVVLHLRAKRRWRTEQAAPSEPVSTGA
ncbi:MAG: hypothetical protein OXF75_11350 [Acidimicrobiaceae bacterium]|nr:hypothetical protein [Acidimicrobiaceae bacterium]